MTSVNRRLFVAVCLVMSTACGGEGGSPTSPTSPTGTTTRIIIIDGDLSFGDLLIGQSAERPITIRNTGTGALTVTGLTVPSGGGPAFFTSWSSGTIASNGSQNVTLRFAPTEHRSYSGVLTVTANHTGGQNTIPINASGLRPLYEHSGVGNTVFDVPTHVTRVRITGSTTQRCQNFIMHIGGRNVVNEILGTGCSAFVGSLGPTYSGEHLVTGGLSETVNSNGIAWTITELR